MDVTSSCKSPLNTGVQRVVRGLFRHLVEAEYAVTPLVWEPRGDSYCRLSKSERGFLEQPFQHRRNASPTAKPDRRANPIPIWSKLWRQVGRRHSRLDLAGSLQSGDVFFVPEIYQDRRTEFVTKQPANRNIRRVAIFHDAIAWRHPEITPEKRQTGFAAYLRSLACFDEVLAVSQEAAEDLQAFWQVSNVAKTPPIRVSGWPVDEPFSTEANAAKSEARPKVLCVGTFEPRKNHLTLLAAAEGVWNACGPIFELVLIGRSAAGFGERVGAEIERLRKNGRPVIWRRHVDDQTLTAAYIECAFTIFPSLVEGFGLPILESLHCGRPCICGSNGALGELARGGGCLMIDQTTVGALSKALRRLVADADLRERLSREARARKFLTWPDFIQEHASFFGKQNKELVL